MATKWNEADCRHLLFARDKFRFSFTKIGGILGRSKSACISKYQQLTGIRKGRLYVPTEKRNG